MRFTVVSYADRAKQYRSLEGKNEAFLVRDNWDDYGLKTAFSLVYFDENKERYEIGEVKIIQAGMSTGYVEVPYRFETLPQDYGSLGQNQSYYETLMELEEHVSATILNSLRDVVWDEAILESLAQDGAYGTSLRRSVGDVRFKKQRSVLHEPTALTPFNFAYQFASSEEQIRITVVPGSVPPTNIHVVIGRNGVGKTTLLEQFQFTRTHSQSWRRSSDTRLV